MRPITLALGLALLMIPGLAPAQTVEEPPFAVEISVFKDGIKVQAARSLIAVDGSVSLSIDNGTSPLRFDAHLASIDGYSDQFKLTTDLRLGDARPQNPIMVARRGHEASFAVGSDDENGMREGVRIILTPARGMADAATPANLK